MQSDRFGHDSIPLETANEPLAGTTLTFLCRAAVATLLAWFASQILNQVVIGEQLIPQSPIADVGTAEYLGLILVSSLLVTVAVAYVAQLSSLRGIALVQALAIAHFGLHHLLTIVEATVFLPTMSAREVGLGIFGGAMQSTILAICIAAAFGKLNPTNNQHATAIPGLPMSKWEWAWKFAACAIAYVFLYIIAGLLILPFVREYYPELAENPIDPVFLIGLQIRRGLVYVACLVPLVRSLRASRVRIAFAVAAFVPIVHGVAGLLVPSEHMGPVAWRVAHMVEIGWSNFVFGLLIGYLFGRGLTASSNPGAGSTDSPETSARNS